MQWFLRRINAEVLPITFGARSQREHPDDFSKLLKKSVLKRAANLSEIECSRCHSEQLWQIRDEKGDIFYICQEGCGKVPLTNEEVIIIYEHDNDAFLKLLADEFGLKANGDAFSEVSEYAHDTLFCIGNYEDKKVKAAVYYLRTDAAHEPASVFDHLGNGTRVLITNTIKPAMLWGKEGTLYCVLAETLAAPSSKQVFDKAKFAKCIEGVRRVRFDKRNGHLLLDNKRIYTAALNSPHYYFLLFLWDKWMEQVVYQDIHRFVREEMEKDVVDTPQKFCQKMKSEIKQKCKVIDDIITNPTIGRYMMADPR